MCAAIFMGRRIFPPRVAPLRGKSCFQSSPVRRRGCLKAGHHKEQFMEIRKVPIKILCYIANNLEQKTCVQWLASVKLYYKKLIYRFVRLIILSFSYNKIKKRYSYDKYYFIDILILSNARFFGIQHPQRNLKLLSNNNWIIDKKS